MLFTDGSLDDVIVVAATAEASLVVAALFFRWMPGLFLCVDSELQSRPTVCSCDSQYTAMPLMYKKPIYTENHHRDAHML